MRPATALRGLAAGAGIVATGVGVTVALTRSEQVRPIVWTRWIVTGAVVHDLVVAPLILGIGWAVVRFVPRPAKAPVQVALIVTGALAAVAYPSVRGFGRKADNPSLLPRDYSSGLAVAVAVTWFVATVWMLARVLTAWRTDGAFRDHEEANNRRAVDRSDPLG